MWISPLCRMPLTITAASCCYCLLLPRSTNRFLQMRVSANPLASSLTLPCADRMPRTSCTG